MEKVVLTSEQIDVINATYGTNANADDVEHYKLCQVILYLESMTDKGSKEANITPK